jgi:geranylgeranyl pyrophosphate synthase
METLFHGLFRSETASEMDHYAYSALMGGGKRLRPILLCLASGFGDAPDEKVSELMAVLEMIHTASLVHDDIVDDSAKRRDKPTLHALKGGHYAAQNGYYIIAAAINILKNHRESGVYEVLASVPMEMSLGELHQLRVEYNLTLQTPQDYLTRIERKTARLIEASCLAGARAAGLDRKQEEALSAYGRSLGSFFQLRDDLLDYEGALGDGKPLFQDINRGIYTLPLLYAQAAASDLVHARLLRKREKSDADLLAILEWVRESGGVAYTRDYMERYADLALAALAALPPAGEREALREIVLCLH